MSKGGHVCFPLVHAQRHFKEHDAACLVGTLGRIGRKAERSALVVYMYPVEPNLCAIESNRKSDSTGIHGQLQLTASLGLQGKSRARARPSIRAHFLTLLLGVPLNARVTPSHASPARGGERGAATLRDLCKLVANQRSFRSD